MRLQCNGQIHKALVENDVRWKVFAHLETFFSLFFSRIFVIVAGSYALRNFCVCSNVNVTISPDDINIYVSCDNIALVYTAFANFLFENECVIGNFEIKTGYMYEVHNIRGLLEIVLVKQDPFETFRIQIICYKEVSVTYYPCKEDFAKSILQNYDISVCKVAILSAQCLNDFFLYLKGMYLTFVLKSSTTSLLVNAMPK